MRRLNRIAASLAPTLKEGRSKPWTRRRTIDGRINGDDGEAEIRNHMLQYDGRQLLVRQVLAGLREEIHRELVHLAVRLVVHRLQHATQLVAALLPARQRGYTVAVEQIHEEHRDANLQPPTKRLNCQPHAFNSTPRPQQ
jgi:hypothetical protein